MNRPLTAIAALSLAAILLSAVVLFRGGMGSPPPGETAAIEETVRTLLREHPEIVGEALQAIMEKRRLAEEERLRLNLKANAKEPNPDPGPGGGARDGRGGVTAGREGRREGADTQGPRMRGGPRLPASPRHRAGHEDPRPPNG